MTIENLLEILIDDAIYYLNGNLSFENGLIMWEYDCKNENEDIIKMYGGVENYLDKTYDHDFEIIEDVVSLDNFVITKPQINGTKILFQIKK